MKNIILGLLLVTSSVSCQSDKSSIQKQENQISTIEYVPSNDILTNPERGFMHTWSVYSEGDPVDMAALESLKNENVSLILRIYYLEEFKSTPLSENQLNLIRTDFSRFREAGIKCVLRFAYTDSMEYPDAPYEIIETHLDQLKPIFTENADIIAFVQAGFIGAWGEWHASSNGLTSLKNKKLVLNKLLEAFPKTIKIQVRTPGYKQEIFEYTDPIGSKVGYGYSDIARVGFHNDCFMASMNDYGTYQNIEEEKLYISKEALFVPTGGETCPPTDVPLATCNTAEEEMALLKWTYLNLDYFEPVLEGWRQDDCFDDFEKKLGYRLALQKSNLNDNALEKGVYELNLSMVNSGFAPIYNMKNAYLIFRSIKNGNVYKKKLALDVCKVIPKVVFDLKESVDLTGIPAGQYELLLKIEDSSEKLADNADYSIRLANESIWEKETGFNKLLHEVTIQ